MTELDPLEKKLSLGWQALSPPGDLKARVRARLPLGGGVAPAATLTRRLSRRWRALRASGPLGATTGAMLLGLGIALGYLIPRTTIVSPAPAAPAALIASTASTASTASEPARHDSSAPRSLPAAAPTATRAEMNDDAADPNAADPNAAAPPSPPATPTLSSPPRSKPPPSSASQLPRRKPDSELAATAHDGAELLLLERAERAVRSKTPALALALTRELDERYPSSALHEERDAIELMAHCQLDESGEAATGTEAAERRARFLERHPESVYAARISKECDASSAADRDEGAAPLR